MKKQSVVLLFVLVAALSACASFRPRLPRPIAFPCRLEKGAFVAAARQLLQQNGYQVGLLDSTSGKVQGSHVPVYTGLGENLLVNGPYLLEAVHTPDTVVVNIYVVLREQNGKVKVLRTLDETNNTNESDKRYFMPVLDGLRQRCR